MKKILLLATGLLFAVATFAQVEAKSQQQPAENPNAPVITFEKTVHDYGTIPYNGDGNCEFNFTNTGKEPLILTNVRSSCGCTVPKWPREPILPGESGVIHVKYSTNRIGTINKSVTVQSNASNPNVVLRIKGQVLSQQQSTMPEKPKSVGEKNK
ncbi:MAG TPA: DUF1573 domain-containing protein [Bacteroidales bacterium]|nr:DUF1573 domain-containing protein [Bacteroidales bacterium]HPR58768.1 DUF1573 domain-containing protein [Bacteroidales bacterium]